MAAPRVWLEGGKWRARAYLGTDPATGRRRRPQVTLTAATEGEARAEADEWARGLTGESLHGMLRAFARDVEVSGAPRSRDPKANTAHAYASKARVLSETMPDKPAGEVTSADVRDLSHELLGQGLSRATVNSYCQFLSSAFGWAIEMGICDSNPVHGSNHPTQPRPDASEKSFTEGEARRIAAWCMERDSDEEAAALDREAAFCVLLMLFTGMRVGEALAVRCQDVSVGMGEVRVRGTLVERGGLSRQDTTKRGGGRTLAVGDHLMRLIAAHMRDKQPWMAVVGNGGLMRPGLVSRALRECCQACGIRYRPPHALRATHASLLIGSGRGDMKAVSERLGHANVGTTLEYYQSVLPGADRALADGFAVIIGGEG